MEKYKKGDKVIVTGNNSPRHGLNIGEAYTIEELLGVKKRSRDYVYSINGRITYGSDLEPAELPIPRMVMVKDKERDAWKKYTLYHVLPDCFGSRYITNSNFSDNPLNWELMKEIEEKPEPIELTMEQLQDELGYEVKVIK